jgi:hypothetical protein
VKRHNFRFHTAATVIAAVSVAAMLTACAPLGPASVPSTAPSAPSDPSTGPGLSRDAAASLLMAVPGVTTAAVGSVISGLSSEAVVEVSVDDQSSILAEGVLDYVLRIGWATMVPTEPAQLSLTVRSNGTLLNLQDEANELTGVDTRALPLLYSAYLDAPGEHLGAWPGAVPAPR